MLISEAKAVAKAEQRALKKRQELFERFDAALIWFPNMKPDLLGKFKVRLLILKPCDAPPIPVSLNPYYTYEEAKISKPLVDMQ
jgi:hypothetical protein